MQFSVTFAHPPPMCEDVVKFYRLAQININIYHMRKFNDLVLEKIKIDRNVLVRNINRGIYEDEVILGAIHNYCF